MKREKFRSEALRVSRGAGSVGLQLESGGVTGVFMDEGGEVRRGKGRAKEHKGDLGKIGCGSMAEMRKARAMGHNGAPF